MPFEKFRRQCEKLAGEHAKLLEVPKRGEADMCLPCFSIGERGKPPTLAAQKLAAKYRFLIKGTLIRDVKNVGPYINFYIDERKFSDAVLQDIFDKGGEYGKGSKKEKILLEHTSINPTGPVHVGRLRNSLIGDSLARLLRFAGHNVETHYYVNDAGKQVAIIAWGGKNKEYDSLVQKYGKYKDKPDFKTMFRYVSSYSEATSSEGGMDEVNSLLEDAETGKKDAIKKLKSVAQHCLDGQKDSLMRMGITFDQFDFESKYIEEGQTKRIIEELRKKGLLEEKGGALGIDLSKYGLEKRRGGMTVLARSNGTSVYMLRDIAYHIEKFKHGRKLINVLGEDHRVEFQELKKIMELLTGSKNMHAVHYAFVIFKGMKLSTRKGETAPLDLLIDEGVEKAMEKIQENEKSNATPKEKAEKIAVAAIKYHILKADNQRQITFIWDDALNFEGNTGPYLQYTYARIRSILRKSGKKPKFKVDDLGKEEHEIIKILSKFPEAAKKAGEEEKPNLMTAYLYELASQLNTYYHNKRIIGSSAEEARLTVLEAASVVLKTGLELLGIETLEEM